MQNDPEKVLGNYNEFQGGTLPFVRIGGNCELQNSIQATKEQLEIIETGHSLVNSRIDEILGYGNRLTASDLVLPTVRFIESAPGHPSYAGYFMSTTNEIVIVTGVVKDRPSQTKTYIHEYLHFLSHNARDDSEQIGEKVPISRNNNVGFRRNFGVDIRKGKEGQITHDYFISFNEAVTEQLAIDIFPEGFETYDDYRGLLSQVIDDAVTQRLGGRSENGIHVPWPKEQFEQYIYRCFLKGNLEAFTRLLQTTYEKYSISEQQFGLMTHRDDLPSVIDNRWRMDNPNEPPPSPAQIAVQVQERLDNKTMDDYPSDIIGPEPDDDHDNQSKYGMEYDTHVAANKIVYSRTKKTIDGEEYDIDSLGYIIYRGEESALIFQLIRTELDALLSVAANEDIDDAAISERMDQLLFDTYVMSMLSEGFRDFYIYKHSKIDNL